MSSSRPDNEVTSDGRRSRSRFWLVRWCTAMALRPVWRTTGDGGPQPDLAGFAVIFAANRVVAGSGGPAPPRAHIAAASRRELVTAQTLGSLVSPAALGRWLGWHLVSPAKRGPFD